MGCLLYYITDRNQFPGNEAERRRALLAKIAEAANFGVDYIQLREKDLSARELEALAREAVAVIRNCDWQRNWRSAPSSQLSVLDPASARILINSRIDVAVVVEADGVHLRSEDVSVEDVRLVWERATVSGERAAARPIVAVSCHTPAEAGRAACSGADFAVFAPVFGKRNQPGVRPTDLDMLNDACKAKIPVLALGGVTLENAVSCRQAGAAGVAGIRLFQENRIEDVVRTLCKSG